MIHDDDYNFIVQLIEKQSGIDLGASGHYLVDARLSNLARELGLAGADVLIANLKKNVNKQLTTCVVGAMTTNESLFFRDGKPFQLLTERLIPYLLEARKNVKTIRIWSAACSTGQEPYSIAICLLEKFPQVKDWKIEILATDLCQKVIERAKLGTFTSLEVSRGLPKEYLLKYFTETADGYVVRESVKKFVVYRELNLIESFSHLGIFDIIFCRNVLIYFNLDLKRKILDGISSLLATDGYLFLGGAESTTGICNLLERVTAEDGIVFRKTTAIKNAI